MSELHVLFKVGAAEYVVPAALVLQMESFSGATPVPGTSRFLAGIILIRGRVVPVIDARKRLGMAAAETDRGLDARVIVTQQGERIVGLLVDSAREVVKLSQEQLEPPPPSVAEQVEGLVTAVARLDKRLVMRIDLDRWVSEEQVHE